MNIDDILPNQEYEMTPELSRLFKAADCDPQICHGCEKPFKIGQKFRLITIELDDRLGLTDEMCCMKCDEKKLQRTYDQHRKARETSYSISSGVRSGGFSRPSKVQP